MGNERCTASVVCVNWSLTLVTGISGPFSTARDVPCTKAGTSRQPEGTSSLSGSMASPVPAWFSSPLEDYVMLCVLQCRMNVCSLWLYCVLHVYDHEMLLLFNSTVKLMSSFLHHQYGG